MNRRLLVLPFVLGFAILTGVAVAARPTKRLDDVERGKQLYERHCVQCHGSAVDGQGAAAGALVAKVPDLRGDALQESHQDQDVTLVLAGKGAMPSFEASFDRYDGRRVMRYMRDLARGKVDAKEPTPPPAPEPPGEPEE